MKYLLATAVAGALLAPSYAALAAELPVLEATPGYYAVPTESVRCGIEPVAVREVRRVILPYGTWSHDLVTVVRDREVCRTVFGVGQAHAGYNVRFRDETGEYTAFMTQHPGKAVTIVAGQLQPAG